MKLEFQNTDGGLNGTLEFRGQQYRFSVKEVAGDLEGVFKTGDAVHKFTLASEPGALVFQTEGFTDRLAAIVPTFVNSLGMKFVAVPGTDVQFCIWETRVKDYRAYANASSGVDNSWQNPEHGGQRVTPSEDCPVVNVSWNDAKAFCAWLSRKEGKTYRLPTDAEWSVAVGLRSESCSSPRDKDTKIKDVYPWGTQWPPPQGAGNYADASAKTKHSGWKVIDGYDDGYSETAPVGSFKANQFGLFDLGGNVWEWCEDWYDGEQKSRVLRGASWDNRAPDALWSSYRYGNPPYSAAPGDRRSIYGIRVVLVGMSSP
jgi:hypothetical protein